MGNSILLQIIQIILIAKNKFYNNPSLLIYCHQAAMDKCSIIGRELLCCAETNSSNCLLFKWAVSRAVCLCITLLQNVIWLLNTNIDLFAPVLQGNHVG